MSHTDGSVIYMDLFGDGSVTMDLFGEEFSVKQGEWATQSAQSLWIYLVRSSQPSRVNGPHRRLSHYGSIW